MILGYNNALDASENKELKRTHGAYSYLNYFINEENSEFANQGIPNQASVSSMKEVPNFVQRDSVDHTRSQTYKKSNTTLCCIEDGLSMGFNPPPGVDFIPNSVQQININGSPNQANYSQPRYEQAQYTNQGSDQSTLTKQRDAKKPKFQSRRLKCFESCHRKGLEQEYRRSMGSHNMNGNGQYGPENSDDFFSDDFDVVYDQTYDNQVDDYINLYLNNGDSGIPFVF